MAWRESHNVEPMIFYDNPVPTATRTGNMLFTSVITGRDLETGAVPDDAAGQARNAFRTLQKILESFGSSAGEVASMRVYLKTAAARPDVNDAWVEMFPNENSRPARHVVMDPELSALVRIEAVAVIEPK